VAGLVLGPMLRFADDTRATVWVETDRAADVEVLGHRARSFHVAGHHYALVVIGGLEPAAAVPYDVRLDGEPVWPRPDDPRPPPVVRTRVANRTRLVFGSCRAASPDERPWSLTAAEHPLGRGPDALKAYARRLMRQDHDAWPDALLMLGDQVYADDASPWTRAFARTRRDTGRPPYEDVADLEEYTELYREAWSHPDVRWLLSTLPTAMIFDDHDIIDDWNTSARWLRQARSWDWWDARIVGGLSAYWLYQHLGNLDPDDLSDDPLYHEVGGLEDAAPLLGEMARAADRDPTTFRWSFDRDLGLAHLVTVDSRAGRILDGDRDMIDEGEWRWFEDRLREPTRHLLVATSLPLLLPPAVHDVERWDEALVAGAWGAPGVRLGEVVRQAVDLEQWPAFGAAFDRLVGDLHDVAAGVHGHRPDTLAVLSGDVHHGYVAEARWPDVERPLWQVVASPMRQEISLPARASYRFARTPPGRALGRVLRRLAGVAAPELSWDLVDGPVMANHIATLDIGDGDAVLRLEVAERTPSDGVRLVTAVERDLTGVQRSGRTATADRRARRLRVVDT
jgi:hypothetical protein